MGGVVSAEQDDAAAACGRGAQKRFHAAPPCLPHFAPDRRTRRPPSSVAASKVDRCFRRARHDDSALARSFGPNPAIQDAETDAEAT
jgi:hypothetical protein